MIEFNAWKVFIWSITINDSVCSRQQRLLICSAPPSSIAPSIGCAIWADAVAKVQKIFEPNNYSWEKCCFLYGTDVAWWKNYADKSGVSSPCFIPPLPFRCFHCLGNGVSHTATLGLSQTDPLGVTHTDFGVVEVSCWWFFNRVICGSGSRKTKGQQAVTALQCYSSKINCEKSKFDSIFKI